MTKQEKKRHQLLEKYASKMHSGFCKAAGLCIKDTGGVWCLLPSFVNCWYNEMSLLEWDVTVTISLVYNPKKRNMYISITANNHFKKNNEIVRLINRYVLDTTGYCLKAKIIDDKDNISQVIFDYLKDNVGMGQIEETVYDVLSEFCSDEINKYLDPIMNAIRQKGGNKNV